MRECRGDSSLLWRFAGKEEIYAVVALVRKVEAGSMSNPRHDAVPAVGKLDARDGDGTPTVQCPDIADLLSHSRQCVIDFSEQEAAATPDPQRGTRPCGLHVFVTVLDGDLGEGDAGGCRVAGGEHAGEVQRSVAVFQIELVHGGGELIAIAGLFEERGLDLGFGDEIAQSDADEEGLLMLGGGGRLPPAALQGFEERERVLAGTKAGFHAPAGLSDAAEVLLYF